MKLLSPHIAAVMLLFGLGLVAGACDRQGPAPPPPPPPAAQPPKLTTVPLEVTVKQRTTTAVPGSDGRLLLTVDDVTRDQIMVSIATDAAGGAAEVLLPPRSMSPGDAARFTFSGVAYQLALKRLENALAGDDIATFVIAGASPATTTTTTATATTSLTEEAKIERLIQAVADLKGATFIRNGDEHGAAEAASHLRSKWRASAGRVATAEQFISGIASKSSVSGEPYQIRLPDGGLVPAGQFLRARLAEIESGR